MIGDGMTDFESCPPAVSSYLFINKSLPFLSNFFSNLKNAFIGFGGNVVREKVKKNSAWYATNFQQLIHEISDKENIVIV